MYTRLLLSSLYTRLLLSSLYTRLLLSSLYTRLLLSSLYTRLLLSSLYTSFSFRKIDNDSTNCIKRLLQATDWWIMHSLCVDKQSEFLSSNNIQEYIDLCVPLKTVTIGHRYVIREKRMTKGLLKSSLNLNKLRSKISKNNNNVSIIEYKMYRNLYNRLIRIAKAAYYNEQIEQRRYQKYGKF